MRIFVFVAVSRICVIAAAAAAANIHELALPIQVQLPRTELATPPRRRQLESQRASEKKRFCGHNLPASRVSSRALDKLRVDVLAQVF